MVSHLEKQYDLTNLRVGILGMAFKGESDDIRSSLSYKLKRILEFRSREVLCTDPYVTVDENLVPLEVCSPSVTYSCSVRRTRCTASSRPTSPSWTCGTCAVRGAPYESGGLGRHPGVQRG